MFDHEKRITELESVVRDLMERAKRENSLFDAVGALQKDVRPFRIGPFRLPAVWHFSTDLRPTVSVREAVELILDHLHVRLSKVSAIPERIELEKVKK
jgi:hypothetical protein